MSLCDISVITTEAPCEAALTRVRHVHIEICISLYVLLSLPFVQDKAQVVFVLHESSVCGAQESVMQGKGTMGDYKGGKKARQKKLAFAAGTCYDEKEDTRYLLKDETAKKDS